jgi:hypothetical protein
MNRVKHLKLTKSRHAVSAVISNMILIAAVLTIGLVALGWTQAQSADYQKTQTAAMDKNINQLKERMSLEIANYKPASVAPATQNNTLTLYFLNSGLVNVTIQNIYLDNDIISLPFVTHHFNGSPDSNTIGFTSTNREGIVELQISSNLSQGTSHSVTVKTLGGSTFGYSFIA